MIKLTSLSDSKLDGKLVKGNLCHETYCRSLESVLSTPEKFTFRIISSLRLLIFVKASALKGVSCGFSGFKTIAFTYSVP